MVLIDGGKHLVVDRRWYFCGFLSGLRQCLNAFLVNGFVIRPVHMPSADQILQHRAIPTPTRHVVYRVHNVPRLLHNLLKECLSRVFECTFTSRGVVNLLG